MINLSDQPGLSQLSWVNKTAPVDTYSEQPAQTRIGRNIVPVRRFGFDQ